MRNVLGLLLIVLGVVAAVWAGLWWAFIGGIIDLIHAVRAPELVAGDVVIGVAKIVFAGLIAWLAAVVPIASGVVLLGSSSNARSALRMR